MTAYAELQVASAFSFLRGASLPEELVATAAALGLDAVAITDRDTLAGVVRAHVAAKQAGIRLVVGARLAPPRRTGTAGAAHRPRRLWPAVGAHHHGPSPRAQGRMRPRAGRRLRPRRRPDRRRRPARRARCGLRRDPFETQK